MSTSINAVSSAVSSALQGLSNATAAFNSDAQAIASGVQGGDITGAALDLTQENILAQINVSVLAMSEKTLGSLLDVTA
jgi:hypothetical protein